MWSIIINSTHSAGQQNSRTSLSRLTEPLHPLNSTSISRSPPVSGSHCSTSSFYEFEYFSYLIQRRQWQATPVLLPGKSHGRRSLVGCSPWGHYQSDMTKRLHFQFSLSRIGEGNGNPLQCSCLENPRDGGACGLLSLGSHRVRHN